MTRRAIPREIETEVLTLCRRRCCVCFGLENDMALKHGQMAHLDGRPDNNRVDNLAFLCLDHHDQYDSRTSQSKGLTEAEVKTYQGELHGVIGTQWSQSNRPGQARLERAPGEISGHYIRPGEWDGAELQLVGKIDGSVRVIGIASWGMTREYGPNLGQLDFEAEVIDGRLTFTDEVTGGGEYRLEIEFLGDKLMVREGPTTAYHGARVTFTGEYKLMDYAQSPAS